MLSRPEARILLYGNRWTRLCCGTVGLANWERCWRPPARWSCPTPRSRQAAVVAWVPFCMWETGSNGQRSACKPASVCLWPLQGISIQDSVSQLLQDSGVSAHTVGCAAPSPDLSEDVRQALSSNAKVQVLVVCASEDLQLQDEVQQLEEITGRAQRRSASLRAPGTSSCKGRPCHAHLGNRTLSC